MTAKPERPMISRIWHALVKAAPLRLWSLFGAGMILTVLNIWHTLILWRGGPIPAQQLTLIGWLSIMNAGMIAIVLVSLASAKFKASGPGGISLEVDGDEDNPPSSVKVEVKQ